MEKCETYFVLISFLYSLNWFRTFVIILPRFQEDFLQKELFSWVFADAKLFDEPIKFQPTKGCQVFMLVDRAFWQAQLSPSNFTGDDSALIITLGADETQRILAGEQTYLLRSQRVGQLGRVHLAVSTGIRYSRNCGVCRGAGVRRFTSVQELGWVGRLQSLGHRDRQLHDEAFAKWEDHLSHQTRSP